MTTGDVELTILDGGGSTVIVPASEVAVVIGVCSGGTAATIVASRDPISLTNTVGIGPGVELAATIIARGGTVLFMKAATITAGACGAVTAFATGTSVVTTTTNPYDSYFVKFLVVHGGTRGTAGITFKISLDAGRNYGPVIALGTATTYAIAGTGMTLAFGAGTMVSGESVTLIATQPLTSAASVSACLVALEASPYSVTGWGSMIIDGGTLFGGAADGTFGWTGSDASTIEGYLDTMVTTKTFPRAILSARDNKVPATLWGGAGETDAAWYAALGTDYSAVSAKRICAVGGFYNMPGQYQIAAAGLPRYRRPGAWALAARQVQIAPQTHAGRVSDGALETIIVDPTVDPTDGFNYHDELTAPALDTARFTSFRKRKGRPGFFVVNPKLMSPFGSAFTMLPLGNVMDIGCALLHQTMEENINADVRLNDNGTIDEIAAQGVESVARGVLRDNMLSKSMISNFAFSIDRTNNVRSTSTVNFSATLFSRGYILEIDGTIGFGNTTGG